MTIKRKSGPAREHSLAELRAINIRTMENHQKLDDILNAKKEEVSTMRNSLYVEVQNFREAHQAEIRRSVEVVLDLATRSLPWWKRSLANIVTRAELLTPQIARMVKKEAERVKAEVEEINAKEQAEQAKTLEQMKKDKAELERVAAAANVPGDAEPGVDDGFGGVTTTKAPPEPKTPNVDEYELDTTLLDEQVVAEEIEEVEPLTPVDFNA